MQHHKISQLPIKIFPVPKTKWYSKGLWQWLIHYMKIMLDIVCCMRYVWYTHCFGSWLYCIFRWSSSLRTGLGPRLIPSVATNIRKDSNKSVSIMTTKHQKTGVEPTLETSHVWNVLQTVDNIQHDDGYLLGCFAVLGSYFSSTALPLQRVPGTH
jgi:hypothetical protein